MGKRVLISWVLALAILPTAWIKAEEPHPAATPAAHATEAAAEGHAAASDEPRHHELIEVDPVTAIWVIIIFLVMLAVLYPTAWKNVLAGLKAREERIRKDISDAEATRAKAEATLREYNAKLATAEAQVRELLNKATVESEQIATQAKTRTQQEVEEIKERATREIEASKKQAIREIHTEAAELSTRIAEKIIRRTLNTDDQRDLVRSSLEQLAK